MNLRKLLVKVREKVPHQRHRIAAVGHIAGEDDFFLFIDRHSLHRRGPRVDAHIGFPAGKKRRVGGDAVPLMPLHKLSVFPIVGKKGLAALIVVF